MLRHAVTGCELLHMIYQPGVAGAVPQTPLQFYDLLINSFGHPL